MAGFELLTPDQIRETTKECPHWQRMVSTGNCVDRWWMGPPVSTAVNVAALALTVGLLGWIAGSISKIKILRPVADVLNKATKMEANGRARPRRRARRRRYWGQGRNT